LTPVGPFCPDRTFVSVAGSVHNLIKLIWL
jgi:hypothetical protein